MVIKFPGSVLVCVSISHLLSIPAHRLLMLMTSRRLHILVSLIVTERRYARYIESLSPAIYLHKLMYHYASIFQHLRCVTTKMEKQGLLQL
jgi:hypothetical protein